MVALRGGAVLQLVMCVGIAVTGCSPSTTTFGYATKAARTTTPSTTTPSTTTPSTSVSAAAGYDVSRLSQLRGDFPVGFIPGRPSAPIKVGQQLVAAVGSVASYGQPFTVSPPQCRPLLKPVDGQVGADSMHVRGDELEKRQISVGAINPVTVPAEIPSTGCDRFTYDVDEGEHPLSGTVERLAAPAIDGAVTIAVRFDAKGFPNVEYSYAAILDGRVYVDVQARLAPEFQAEPALSELLLKAVAAVRGQ